MGEHDDGRTGVGTRTLDRQFHALIFFACFKSKYCMIEFCENGSGMGLEVTFDEDCDELNWSWVITMKKNIFSKSI